MSEVVDESLSRLPFYKILNAHLTNGDGNGVVNGKRQPWTSNTLANRLRVTPASVTNWRQGYNFPQPDNFRDLIIVLFGEDYRNSPEARFLVDLYNRQSQFYLYVKPSDDIIEEQATEQVSAAFRFGVINEKIDALPPNNQVNDPEAAEDLLNELRSKLSYLMNELLEPIRMNMLGRSLEDCA